VTYLRNKKGRFIKGTKQPHGFKKGHKAWNKGIPRTEETKNKLSKSLYGKHRLKINLSPSPSLSYIIGVLLGDGEVRNGGIRLQQTKREFADEFIKHTKNIGFNPFISNPPSVLKKNQIRVLASSKNFLEWFKNLPIKDIQNHVKDFPFYFLKGLYESDGSRQRSNITFYNTNIYILHIAKHLLNDNGFNTVWGEYTTPKGRPYYHLRVLGGYEKMNDLIKLMNPAIKNELYRRNPE